MPLVEQWDQNRRTTPPWVADFPLERDFWRAPTLLDTVQFTDQGGLVVTVGVAGAAQNATSVPVTVTSPLGGYVTNVLGTNPKIPAGTTIDLGGVKIMRLTADLFLGATTAAVSALPTALVSGDIGRYNRLGKLYVPSGTIVGRTFAERTSGTGFGPGDVATPDDELALTYSIVHDARTNPQVLLLRPGGKTAIYENNLPGFASLSGAQLVWLRANYHCITQSTAP
jgi:hypothetical protein